MPVKKTLRWRRKPFVAGMSEVNQMIVKRCRKAVRDKRVRDGSFLRPKGPIERAVLDRFGNVLGFDRLLSRQIRDSSGYF